jgi:hypothetical protein
MAESEASNRRLTLRKKIQFTIGTTLLLIFAAEALVRVLLMAKRKLFHAHNIATTHFDPFEVKDSEHPLTGY